MKELYVVEGYLEDRDGNRISEDFQYETQATSFEEAERNAVFTIKTKRLKLTKNAYAKLVQIEGKHFTYRNARDV